MRMPSWMRVWTWTWNNECFTGSFIPSCRFVMRRLGVAVRGYHPKVDSVNLDRVLHAGSHIGNHSVQETS